MILSGNFVSLLFFELLRFNFFGSANSSFTHCVLSYTDGSYS